MNTPKISIQIVTWNSEKFISDCLASIFAQTYRNFSVLMIDNASVDETVEIVKTRFPEVKIITNSKNLGFSRAHNQGFVLTKNVEYVLVSNADIILEDNFLENLVKTAEDHSEAGSFSGKILRIEFTDFELNQQEKKKIIDTVGLSISKSRVFKDIGQGQNENPIFNRPGYVFGVSGALTFFRREALEDIKLEIKRNKLITNEEYYDEDFFAYREDIDLAWRLQTAGWRAYYEPEAVAYHFRSARAVSKKRPLAFIKNRREKSPLINYLSYRNHIYTLLKNEDWHNFLLDFPRILFFEKAKFWYILFFEPATLKAWRDIFKNFVLMLKKRRKISALHQINWRAIRKSFI